MHVLSLYPQRPAGPADTVFPAPSHQRCRHIHCMRAEWIEIVCPSFTAIENSVTSPLKMSLCRGLPKVRSWRPPHHWSGACRAVRTRNTPVVSTFASGSRHGSRQSCHGRYQLLGGTSCIDTVLVKREELPTAAGRQTSGEGMPEVLAAGWAFMPAPWQGCAKPSMRRLKTTSRLAPESERTRRRPVRGGSCSRSAPRFTKAALAAELSGKSLNQWAEDVLDQAAGQGPHNIGVLMRRSMYRSKIFSSGASYVIAFKS